MNYYIHFRVFTSEMCRICLNVIFIHDFSPVNYRDIPTTVCEMFDFIPLHLTFRCSNIKWCAAKYKALSIIVRHAC